VETDVKENNEFTTFATTTKGFGDRKYTASYDFYHFMYPDTHFRLINRYKINKSGLTMNSLSTAGTSAVIPTTVAVRRTTITDKYAEKEGWDINGLADYNLTQVGYNGVGLISLDISIRSTIKLDTLYSSSAKVSQSRTVDK